MSYKGLELPYLNQKKVLAFNQTLVLAKIARCYCYELLRQCRFEVILAASYVSCKLHIHFMYFYLASPVIPTNDLIAS